MVETIPSLPLSPVLLLVTSIPGRRLAISLVLAQPQFLAYHSPRLPSHTIVRIFLVLAVDFQSLQQHASVEKTIYMPDAPSHESAKCF